MVEVIEQVMPEACPDYSATRQVKLTILRTTDAPLTSSILAAPNRRLHYRHAHTVKWLFEVNRDRVSGRSPGVTAWRWRCVISGCRGCRPCGPGGAGSRGCGRNMRGALRVWRCGSGSLTWRSIESSTTHEPVDQAGPERVRVVHPFHPWFGRDLEFVKRRRNWRADRVYVFGDAGELVSLPVEWTDLALADPFVVVAAGRAPFRTADLLKLADEVARLRSVADGVQKILS